VGKPRGCKVRTPRLWGGLCSCGRPAGAYLAGRDGVRGDEAGKVRALRPVLGLLESGSALRARQLVRSFLRAESASFRSGRRHGACIEARRDVRQAPRQRPPQSASKAEASPRFGSLYRASCSAETRHRGLCSASLVTPARPGEDRPGLFRASNLSAPSSGGSRPTLNCGWVRAGVAVANSVPSAGGEQRRTGLYSVSPGHGICIRDPITRVIGP
jgi:hypothetical protein